MSDALQVEIAAGIFALLVTIISPVIGHRLATRHKRRVETLEHELFIQRRVLSMSRYMGHWEEIKHDIDRLFAETGINRFLLLVSFNGAEEPLWVTATHQYRGPDKKKFDFIHTDIDKHYRHMLFDIQRYQSRDYKTEDLPDCLLRDIYEMEGVTGSTVHHLGSYMHVGGCKEIDFCSYATDEPGGLKPMWITQCRLISDRLRGLASQMEVALKIQESING